MEWQPIETAPLDGTVVIVAANGKTYAASYFDLPFKEYRDADGFYLGQQDPECFWGAYGDDHEELEPTHWMPLPPPPED